jgi:hypothetical protein
MPKKNIKSFSFKTDKGVEYCVNKIKIPARDKAEGLCDSPENEYPKILIEASLLPRREMSVSIEEFAHAFFWDKSEKNVRKFAATLTKYLYANGWRKTF